MLYPAQLATPLEACALPVVPPLGIFVLGMLAGACLLALFVGLIWGTK